MQRIYRRSTHARDCFRAGPHPRRRSGAIFHRPPVAVHQPAVLVLPIIAALTRQAVDDLWTEYRDELTAMRVRPLRRVTTLLWHPRFTLVTTLLAGGVEQERTIN